MPDFEVPGRYLRENFDPNDRLAVVLIERQTQSVEQKLATAEQIATPKYQAHLRAANASGKDVFISMNTIKPEASGRTKADIDVVRHLYLDVDQGAGKRSSAFSMTRKCRTRIMCSKPVRDGIRSSGR